MRQLLLNSDGAVVARMPRPRCGDHEVLVKVHYSMISVGTELASFRQPRSDASDAMKETEDCISHIKWAKIYLMKTIQNPRKTVRKVWQITNRYFNQSQCTSSAISDTKFNSGQIELDTEEAEVQLEGDHELPRSEMQEQGWNVGYSAVGDVIAIGAFIDDLTIGDKVACAGTGKANHADFISVPRNLICRLPKNCSLRAAASVTLGAIALQGVRRAQPALGETVAVIGLGLLGQLTVQMLKANGCVVLGMDLLQSRIDRAQSLGMLAGHVDSEQYKKLVRDYTETHGVDVTIITASTKSDVVVNLAMEITRRKGRVVVVGDIGLGIERANFYKKEIDLLISTSYGPGRYDTDYEEKGRDYPYAYVRWTMNRNMQAYLDLVTRKTIDVESLIDKTVPILQAPEVYKELCDDINRNMLGIIIQYDQDRRDLPDSTDATLIHLRGHHEVKTDRVQYVLVGASTFGMSTIVPQLDKLSKTFFLKGVVSRDVVRGGNFARSKNLEILASELESVLEDPSVNMLVITTRHHEHAKQVVAGLKAGKHIFVEKPLALTWQELDTIHQTYSSLPSKPILTIGFNRRFSPSMQILKRELSSRRSPLMIHYRLNGGYIDPQNWIQTESGGGRNRGEACHVYDCFRYLIGSDVCNIQAMSIRPTQNSYLQNDNFVATLRYEDGSVANLVYTALGPEQGLSKEYIEVFVDGETYIIDDYKKLIRAGEGKELWYGETDKGHFNELSALAASLNKKDVSPIPYSEILETTAIALHVEDLIKERY